MMNSQPTKEADQFSKALTKTMIALRNSTPEDINAKQAFHDFQTDPGPTLTPTDYFARRLPTNDDENKGPVRRGIQISNLRDAGLLEKLYLLAGEIYQRQHSEGINADALNILSPDKLFATILIRQTGRIDGE